MNRQVELHIRGRVQGVWFRAQTKAKADELGLTGWVRNEPDGSVTALGCGEAGAIELWIGWCRQGPPLAKVDSVGIRETEPGIWPDFRIDR